MTLHLHPRCARSCHSLLLGVFALLGTSCQHLLTTEESTDLRNHVIMIRAAGTAEDPLYGLTVGHGGLQEKEQLPLAPQLEQIEKNFATYPRGKDGKLHLLVFVHGGLHTTGGSCDMYRQLIAPMKADGYYPIFIVWNSDLYSSYWEHLVTVRQGEEHKFYGKLTAPFLLPIDLASALIRTPVVWTNQIYNDWQTTEYEASPQNLVHTFVEHSLREENPDGFRLGEDYRTRIERGVYFGFYVLTFPIKLATSPIVDGFGGKAWASMLRRTDTMYHPPTSEDIFKTISTVDGDHTIAPENKDPAKKQAFQEWYMQEANPGAMWIFSRRLRDWSKHLDCDIELYGHSMGTIVLNRLLQEVPDIKVSRIGYLAAACSSQDWENSVLRYMLSEQGQKTEFYSVSLHRMREQSERNPGDYLDLTPRGSLLTWIDDFLTDPNTISKRTFGSWENALRVVPEFANKVVLPVGETTAVAAVPQTTALVPATNDTRIHLHSLDALKGSPFRANNDQPQKHGDFIEWPFWKMDFLWPDDNLHMPQRLVAVPAKVLPDDKH